MKRLIVLSVLLSLPINAQEIIFKSGFENPPTGTASQSTTISASVNTDASNAIDGITDGDGADGDLLSHTEFETNPWWRVDLDGSYTIDSIAIWNRTDGFQSRLSDFTVSILDSGDNVKWSMVFAGTAGTPTILDTSYTLGTTVIIQLNGTNYLTLAEVQLFSASDCQGLCRLGM